MKTLIPLVLLFSCGEPEVEIIPCVSLFGAPTASTGMGEGECGPACDCGEEPFTPPTYSESEILSLEAASPTNTPEVLSEDPYEASPNASPDDSQFCGILGEASAYALQSFESEAAAADAGATITHRGACGQCSSLQNLAVYIRSSDLTEPVQECAMKGMFEGEEAARNCLEDIGFDTACAQIWYFNTQHTSEVCLDICLENLNSPHHKEDGSLNDCIQCDEDESGAVFKAIAGRTRRNSGLASSLCRPCDSIYPVEHRYFQESGR
jgi:hypothetical protein